MPAIPGARVAANVGGASARVSFESIPYSDVAFFFLHLLSSVTSGFAVFYLLCNASIRRYPSVHTLLPACTAEMVKSLISMAFHAFVVFHGGIEQLGNAGCSAWGVVLYFGIPLTLYFNAAITFERHRAVISLDASSKSFYAISVGLLVATLAIALARTFIGQGYQLSPGALYCMTNFAARDPVDFGLNILGLVLNGSALSILVYYQAKIFMMYRRTQREVRGIVESPKNLLRTYNRHASREAKNQEGTLLFRMGLLTFTMGISWTPLTILMLHDVVTGTRASGVFDFVACSVFVIAQSLVPVILLLCTPIIKKALLQSYHYARTGEYPLEEQFSVHSGCSSNKSTLALRWKSAPVVQISYPSQTWSGSDSRRHAKSSPVMLSSSF